MKKLVDMIAHPTEGAKEWRGDAAHAEHLDAKTRVQDQIHRANLMQSHRDLGATAQAAGRSFGKRKV